MSPVILVAVIFLLVSLVLFYIGYLIRVKKQLNLIAGYDPNRVKDKDGLAQFVGMGIQTMAGLEILISLLMIVMPTLQSVLVLAFVIVNVGGVIYLLLNVRKYT